MDKLRETQEAYQTMSHHLSQIETDNVILLRQVQALMPIEEVIQYGVLLLLAMKIY